MMAILTPPSSFCGPLNVNMMLSPIVTTSPASSFNGRQRVSGPISEFWRAVVTLKGARPGTVDDAGWRDTAAFIMSLRGGENRVRLYDPRRSPMRGAGSVTDTAAVGAAATAGATTLTLKGLIASQAVSLAADDHLSIGENLYTVTAHTGSNVSGQATVSLLPPLRYGVAENDAVSLYRPTGVFRLVGGWQDLTVPHYGRAGPLTLEFFEDPEFEA